MRKDPTFRYLEKYVGTYRVMAPYDESTGEFPKNDSFDDLYIPCARGVIKHTYDKGILVWACYNRIKTFNSTAAKIREKYPDIDITIEDCGEDGLLFFHEDDLRKIATIVKPKTAGKNVKPYSKRNLDKKNSLTKSSYVIPESDLAKLANLGNGLDKVTKIHIAKSSYKEFDKYISKKLGIKDVKADREDKELSNKEYIHSLGLWDEYLRTYKKLVKESLK